MCKDCLNEFRPERGSVCLETGTYVLNFKACAKCKKKTLLKVVERKYVEDEDEDDLYTETITYKHVCSTCGHEICEHFYSFEADGKTQEYLMECPLCGRGEHTTNLECEAEDSNTHRHEHEVEKAGDSDMERKKEEDKTGQIQDQLAILRKSILVCQETSDAISDGDEEEEWE